MCGSKGSSMTDASNPMVRRRRLRGELRTARQEAGRTQEQVAAEMEWSLSKIIRIEAGSVGISTNDLKALLQYYGFVDPIRINELLELARAAKEPSWSNKHKDLLSPGLLQFIDYETATSIRREFDHLLVPGLLQTEEYAHAILQRYAKEPTDKKVAALVEVRMRRQDLLAKKTDPPLLFFVLDEAVIHRHVGGSAVMRRQIQHLIDMASPRVTIEIIPYSAGAHPAMERPFVILEFPDVADDDLLYLESPRGDQVSEDTEEVLSYREAFEELRKLSLGPDGSREYLRKLAVEMA
jgi:transcriptional regulator with XRE-family HTH domain